MAITNLFFVPNKTIIIWGNYNLSENLRINDTDAPPDMSVQKSNYARSGDGFLVKTKEPNEDFEFGIRFHRNVEINDFLSQLRTAFNDEYEAELTITNIDSTSGEPMYSYTRCTLKDLSFLSAPIDKTGEAEATITFLVGNEPEQ